MNKKEAAKIINKGLQKCKEAEKFNKAVRKAIDTETYDEFLESHGFADAWEVLEYLLNLLYGKHYSPKGVRDEDS